MCNPRKRKTSLKKNRGLKRSRKSLLRPLKSQKSKKKRLKKSSKKKTRKQRLAERGEELVKERNGCNNNLYENT